MSGITERRLWIRQQQIAKNDHNNIHTDEVNDGDILVWKVNRWTNTNIKNILSDTTAVTSLDKKINTYDVDKLPSIINTEIGEQICINFTDNERKIFTWTGKTLQISGETIEIKML